MIVQSGWVSAPSGKALRYFFSEHFNPLAFASMPYDVFGAYIDTIVLVAEKKPPTKDWGNSVSLISFPPKHKIASQEEFAQFEKQADPRKWLVGVDREFLVTTSDQEQNLIRKILDASIKLENIADIQRGVTPFHTSETPPKKNAARAFSGTIRRYSFDKGDTMYIQYDETLAEYKPDRYFKGDRLLLRELISRQFQLQACYVNTDFITNKSMQSILVKAPYDANFVLGIINSKLLSWLFLSVNSVGRRDDFPKIVLKQTRELPVPDLNFTNRSDREKHDKISSLAAKMQSLRGRELTESKNQGGTIPDRQLAATDREIDKLVYELYGLTEEEIKIVEGNG